MRVLVTGAVGFIGSHTMKELFNRGFDVIGTDVAASNGVLPADITELQQVITVIEKVRPDAVIHLAAISGTTGKNEAEQSLRQPLLNFRVNVLGTANICEACMEGCTCNKGTRRRDLSSRHSTRGRNRFLPGAPPAPVRQHC